MKYAVLSGVTALLLAAAAQASHNASVSPMFEFPFPPSGNIPAEGDQSSLSRHGQFVTVEVETSGLDPLSSYTIWAVIFNDPRFCASTPCGLTDLALLPGHDPRVQSSMVNITGGSSDADGRGMFSGEVWKTFRGAAPRQPAFGPGLLNARKAEIHIVVRGHGQPAGLEDLIESIASHRGGCNDANAVQPPCEDQQISVHTAN